MRKENSMSRPQSQFAKCLENIFDSSKMFSWAGWAIYLSTNQQELRNWVKDKSLPPSVSLRMIISVLQESDGIDAMFIAELKALSEKLASEVTPLEVTGGRISAHIVQPRVEAILRRMYRLPLDKQEVLLDQFVCTVEAAEKTI